MPYSSCEPDGIIGRAKIQLHSLVCSLYPVESCQNAAPDACLTRQTAGVLLLAAGILVAVVICCVILVNTTTRLFRWLAAKRSSTVVASATCWPMPGRTRSRP